MNKLGIALQLLALLLAALMACPGATAGPERTPARNLSASEVRELLENARTVVSELPTLTIQPQFSRRCFARDEAEAELLWTVDNPGTQPWKGMVILWAADAEIGRADLNLPPGESAELKARFAAGQYAVGQGDITALLLRESGQEPEKQKILEIYIGPWRNPQALPVATWPRVKETSCLKEILESGFTIAPFANVADLDNITRLGGFGSKHLHSEGEQLCPQRDELDRIAREAVEAFLAEYENHPSIKYVVANTEQWGEICLCPECREKIKQETGLDGALLAEWIEKGGPRRWKSHTLIPPIDQYLAKEGGVAEPDNPLLRFSYWWWGQGHQLFAINQMMAERFHEVRPDILCVVEPQTRFGTVKRYRSPTVMSDWLYPDYPCDWLPVLAYLKGLQRSWDGVDFIPTMGLVKLYWAPYQVTIPPDILKIETWLCLAHCPQGLDYYFWQAVQPPDQPYWGNATIEECEQAIAGLTPEQIKELPPKRAYLPGVPEALRELSAKVFRPLGPTIRKLELRPSRVAVVYSYTSAVLSDSAWYLAFHWSPLVQKLLSGPYQLEVILDYNLAELAALQRFEAILLPSAYVLPRPAVENLQRFIDVGGLVIGGPSQAGNLRGMVVVEDLDGNDLLKARKGADLDPALVWAELEHHFPPSHRSDSLDLQLRECEAAGTRVLFAVNTRCAPGPLLAKYEKARELGEAVSAILRLQRRPGGQEFCYELGTAQPVPLAEQENYWAFPVDFPAASGKIFAFYPERIAGVRVVAPEQAAPGDKVTLRIEVLNEAGEILPGAVPVQVGVWDAAKYLSDLSHYACTEQGVYEVTLPLPANDPRARGKWTLRVRELASGQEAARELLVQ